MGLLARREHSRRELERKLGKRFRDRPLEPAGLEQVLDRLAADGLQSDARCAESLIHARISRGQGPLKIRAGLREAGLEGETFELLLEAESGEWPRHLDAVVRSRFGEEPPADRRDWARRARFLAGRGFPEHLVRSQLGEPPRS
ncbi:MAG: regulatory protein RecX [Gammaproteobacteria bacterium]|nr:regulatory protein RecX [Gammaproteobacteria bacterium]